MVRAARIGPSPVEDVAAPGALAGAAKRRHPGNEHARVAAEDLVLPAALHAAGDESVGGTHHQDP